MEGYRRANKEKGENEMNNDNEPIAKPKYIGLIESLKHIESIAIQDGMFDTAQKIKEARLQIERDKA